MAANLSPLPRCIDNPLAGLPSIREWCTWSNLQWFDVRLTIALYINRPERTVMKINIRNSVLIFLVDGAYGFHPLGNHQASTQGGCKWRCAQFLFQAGSCIRIEPSHQMAAGPHHCDLPVPSGNGSMDQRTTGVKTYPCQR